MRLKTLSDGSQSVYLDQYVNGQRKYEFLRLYLVPERDAESRERNRMTMLAVNAIKSQRIIALISSRIGMNVSPSDSRMLLANYISRHIEECQHLHRGNSYAANCQNMRRHLQKFLGQRMATLRIDDIDTGLCRDFIDYLRNAKKSNGEFLSATSVHHYFGGFRNLLAAAVTDELIPMNPVDRLKKGEIPRRPLVLRDYLDAVEVATLASTPCRNEQVKQAFLFSCLTGLRISDVRALRWENILQRDGLWRLQMVMKKTQSPIHCKLSQAAVDCLPECCSSGRVFALPSTSSLERIICCWARDAGITKYVTFHTARHSYATMALTAGNDIYTISRLLGHRNVNTTSIYAAVIDEKRDAAVDSVGRLFQKQFSGRVKV